MNHPSNSRICKRQTNQGRSLTTYGRLPPKHLGELNQKASLLPRMPYDAMELGVNKWLLEQDMFRDGTSPQEVVKKAPGNPCLTAYANKPYR